MPEGDPWGVMFVNDGGPMIVLPRELLARWNGVEGGTDGRFGPDYRRACNVRRAAGSLKVGEGLGVVLHEDTPHAQWLCKPVPSAAAVVSWQYCNDGGERGLIDLIRRDDLPWKRFRRRMLVTSGELILMHAGTSGERIERFGPSNVRVGSPESTFATIGDGLPFSVGVGEYKVDVAEVGGTPHRDAFGCLVYRWLKHEVRG